MPATRPASISASQATSDRTGRAPLAGPPQSMIAAGKYRRDSGASPTDSFDRSEIGEFPPSAQRAIVPPSKLIKTSTHRTRLLRFCQSVDRNRSRSTAVRFGFFAATIQSVSHEWTTFDAHGRAEPRAVRFSIYCSREQVPQITETTRTPRGRRGPATHVFEEGCVDRREGDRDRGKPRGSTPPPPPCVRVRTRRFGGGVMRRPVPGWEDRGRRRRRWTERLGGRGAD